MFPRVARFEVLSRPPPPAPPIVCNVLRITFPRYTLVLDDGSTVRCG